MQSWTNKAQPTIQALALQPLELTVDVIRRRFVSAGQAAPHPRKAGAILAALPYGAAATGDSELEVLDLCIANSGNGAVKRLLQLRRDRRGAHD